MPGRCRPRSCAGICRGRSAHRRPARRARPAGSRRRSCPVGRARDRRLCACRPDRRSCRGARPALDRPRDLDAVEPSAFQAQDWARQRRSRAPASARAGPRKLCAFDPTHGESNGEVSDAPRAADCDDDRGHTTGDEECEQCENGHGDDIDNRGRGNSACDSRAGAHIASLLPGHGNSTGPDLESRPAVLYADSCPRPSVFTGTHISPPRAAVCRCERRLARVASAGVQWMTVPVIRLRCSCEDPDVQAFRATCAGRFFRV